MLPGPRVPATTHGRLIGLPGGYPALVDVSSGKIIGECTVVNHTQLTELDDYEEVGEGVLDYQRVERLVTVEGREEKALCYVISEDGEAEWLTHGAYRIPSGDWYQRDN